MRLIHSAVKHKKEKKKDPREPLAVGMGPLKHVKFQFTTVAPL